MPEEITNNIFATLTQLHKDKIEFHNHEFDKLTKEQKSLTKMLDNLYLDKLKGSIADNDYDRFYKSLRDQVADVNVRLEQLQDAEDNYYITAQYVLKLVNRAHELFVSSEVEERRLLLKLVLSNLRVEDENVLWDVQKPFNFIVETADSKLWRS